MTRKEARIYLEDVFPVLNTEMREAIQTLTQEPCEDAISRQAVLELIADYDLSMGQVVKGIHALPSVKPQEPKTGRWKRIGYDLYECSICGQDVMTGDICAYRHCHCCGTRMVSPQESEEKDAT